MSRLEAHPIRREPAILVTGSGRSGTGYLTKVLTECGLRAGHEGWWGLDTDGPEHGLDVDVSWVGCYDEGYTGTVYAQTRHPEPCIASIYANEYRFPWLLVRAQNVALTGDWAVDACRIWVDYTRHAVDRAEHWWQVEQLDAKTLGWFGTDETTAEAALDDVPMEVNHRPRAEFTWPGHPVVDEVLALAERLGYEMDDPR